MMSEPSLVPSLHKKRGGALDPMSHDNIQFLLRGHLCAYIDLTMMSCEGSPTYIRACRMPVIEREPRSGVVYHRLVKKSLWRFYIADSKVSKEKSRICRSESSDKPVRTIFSVSMMLSYTIMKRLFFFHVNGTAGPLSRFGNCLYRSLHMSSFIYNHTCEILNMYH